MRYTFIQDPSGYILPRRLNVVQALIAGCFLKVHRLPSGYSRRIRKSGFGHGIQKGSRDKMVAIESPELQSPPSHRYSTTNVA
jgi:hypothetical protein